MITVKRYKVISSSSSNMIFKYRNENVKQNTILHTYTLIVIDKSREVIQKQQMTNTNTLLDD